MTWTPLYHSVNPGFGLAPVKLAPVKIEGKAYMFDAYDWLDMDSFYFEWGGVENPFYTAPAEGAPR